MNRLAQQGAIEGAQHVQIYLATGERVQIALHLALAGAGLGPSHLPYLELGKRGLLGLEDLGKGPHSGIAYVHGGDVPFTPAFGQRRHQGGLPAPF
jgi:hypothetical protein